MAISKISTTKYYTVLQIVALRYCIFVLSISKYPYWKNQIVSWNPV